ncbi:MAG: hypothetical protein KY469_11695 [Actinobacteria bacterium]|nr:hypothetical protein [Actinomycetota bacterium]
MTVMEKTRQLRARAEASGDTARDAAEATRDTVTDATGAAAERVRDAAGTTAAAVRDVAATTAETARELAEEVPGLLARIVAALTAFVQVLGSRSREVTGELEERGRALAASVEPPRGIRRRRRVRTAAWAGGGFALGFAAGWLVRQRAEQRDVTDEELWTPPSEGEPGPEPVPRAPDLIDARSGNGHT